MQQRSGSIQLEVSLVASSLVLLAATAALGQFAGNIYAPSPPTITSYFEVSAGIAQLSIATFFAAFAVAHLFFGPVSNRVGRRPIMLLGLGLFVLGSIVCALAPNFTILLGGRVLQAIGAAATIVVSRAVTRDRFDGPALQKALAAITVVFALVPGLTPLLGGTLEQYSGWRSSFWVTASTGLAVFGFVVTVLLETHAVSASALSFRKAARTYVLICGDRIFLTYSLAAGAVMASLSAFFAGSPALFIEVIGMSPVEYGFYPLISVVGFMAGGLLVGRFSDKVTLSQIAAAGLPVMLFGASIIFASAALGLLDRIAFASGMVVHITGLGLFLPVGVANALRRFPTRVGAAASMQGFLQTTGATLGVVLVTSLQDLAPNLAVPATMAVFSLLAVAIFTAGRPYTEKAEE